MASDLTISKGELFAVLEKYPDDTLIVTTVRSEILRDAYQKQTPKGVEYSLGIPLNHTYDPKQNIVDIELIS